jgi:hypothetical protein
LSDSVRGQIISVHFAGESVTKTATLLGILRARVSKVMSAYITYGKTTLMKRNWQKQITVN